MPLLVLTRKENETVVIGDDVRVTVLEIRGDKVRVGIDAPQEMAVHREEVWLTIQEQRHDAGKGE